MLPFFAPSPKIPPLHKAAASNNVVQVKSILEKDKKSVNAFAGKHRRTPLHAAACRGARAVVPVLLNNGARIEARDKKAATPLHLAASFGHAPVVYILLDRGANKEAKGHMNYATPLCLAARYGHFGAVRLLLQAGANTNACDQYGQTPLHYAAGFGHTRTVYVLLEYGSSIHAQCSNQYTPLHSAAEGGHLAVVKLLLRYGACLADKSKHLQCTPLELAIMSKHNAVASYLRKKVEEKENVESHKPNSKIAPPDFKAPDVPVSPSLEHSKIEFTPPPTPPLSNVPNPDFKAPDAPASPWPEHSNLEFKPPPTPPLPSMPNHTKHKPSINANESSASIADQKTSELFEKYVEGCRRVIYESIEAYTRKFVLGMLYEVKNEEKSERMLDVAMRDLDLVEHAIRQSRPVLGEHPNSSLDHCLLLAACGGDAKEVFSLLKRGANVSIREQKTCQTALHFAAQGNHPEVISVLLDAGAGEKEINIYQQTPLHLAAYLGNESAVAQLAPMSRAAGKRDCCGNTPLHLAASKGHTFIVSLLKREHKEAFYVRNTFKYLPLDLAAKNGHLTSVVELLKGENLPSVVGEPLMDDLLPLLPMPLHLAAANGHKDVVDYLVKKKKSELEDQPSKPKSYNFDSGGYAGMRALHFAAENGHVEVVQCLIDHGEDINVRAWEKWTTPLHLAQKNDQYRVVKALERNMRLLAMTK